MKREDTYTIYRSEARGEAVRDARNTSEGKKSFIRMKQKFLPKETAVPSEGNFAHLSGSYRPACKLFALIAVLLLLGANWNEVWGQTITPNSKGFPQPNVPTLEQTVYIDNGDTRTFSIAEMENESSHQYAWYVRWYRQNANGEVIELGNAVSAGYYSSLVRTSDGKSLFGHFGINSNPSTYASVTYQGTGQEDILICDLSPNIDDLVDSWEEKNFGNPWYLEYHTAPVIDDNTNITEPVITKRYRYIIKPAKDIADRLAELGDNDVLETFDVTVNNGASNVNLQMPMAVNNYYWQGYGGEYSQGSNFVVSASYKNGSTYNGVSVGDKVITLDEVNDDMVVNVKVNRYHDYYVARFNITVQKDAGFKVENAIGDDERRNPSKYSDKYQLIGYNDFDQDAAISLATEPITAANNASLNPFEDATQTSYGFVYPGTHTTHPFLTPKRGHYGLYRSANVSTYSDERKDYDQSVWAQGLEENDGQYLSNKVYDWYFPRSKSDTEIYDRTYYDTQNTNDHKSGYFYYIDAAVEPGRIVNVKLNGTLCGGTELTVIAWVANMTNHNQGLTTRPNLDFILRGVRTIDGTNDEEKVLHRFSTGEVVNSYQDGDRYHLGEWMQLCYNITISNDDANYNTYYMEVQNNATGSAVGNDFAFDGFEIYKNLPDIIVERKDDCSADTLFVSTDFETLMHNMGWTENQEIDVSAVENDPDLRKYRFGLHGSDPEDPERTAYVGNTYFAFLEGLQEVRNEQGVVTEIKVGTDVTRYNNADDSKPDPATTVLTPGGGQYRWVRVNKNLTVDVPISRFSFRAVVSTQKSITGEHAYPRTQQEAEDAGKVLNFRALKDYNYAVQQWQSDPSAYKPDGLNGADPTVIDINEAGEIVTEGGKIANGELDETSIKLPENEAVYMKLIEELYMRLQIPRIRCPWLDGDELHLYALDVRNTDLKYDGEKVYSDAEHYAEASGQYHVILFGAETVNAWEKPWDENGPGWAGEDGTHYGLDLTSTCNLMTGFVVQPSATIVIETDFEKHTAVCLGSLKKITAELNFYDRESGVSTSKPDFLDYIFDWYLGTEEDYYALADQYEFTVKEALKEYRDDHNHTLAPITREDLQTWHDEEATSDTDRKKAEMLLSLIGNPETGEGVLLRTGTEPGKAFDLEIESTEIMAMPYVTNSEIAIRNYVYCSDETNVDLGVSDSSTPELHIGYVLSPFKGEVPLRLGHVNMSDEVSLTLPVSEGFGCGRRSGSIRSQ